MKKEDFEKAKAIDEDLSKILLKEKEIVGKTERLSSGSPNCHIEVGVGSGLSFDIPCDLIVAHLQKELDDLKVKKQEKEKEFSEI